MPTDDERYVFKPSPIDVSSVRDPGMQSLVILAASLDWNVHQKQNQPVVVTARDGIQKRLPTNTSIRMGVFQSALSTIMVHTELETVPTPELMDAIIAITKPSADHQRRLRLAVGETPAQHRERVAAHEAETKGPRVPEEHLTQRVDEVLDAHFREVLEMPPDRTATDVAVEHRHLGGTASSEHGWIVSREPFMAVRQTKGGFADTYESDTSYERVFEDGFKDYECMECGKVFPTPKGVGSHSQIHTRQREIKEPAWKRAVSQGRVERHVPEPTVEWEEPPGETPAPAGVEEPRDVLSQIIALVAPDLIAERDELRAKNEILALEVERLGQNLQALKDLIGGL